jgi:hypothetical protein
MSLGALEVRKESVVDEVIRRTQTQMSKTTLEDLLEPFVENTAKMMKSKKILEKEYAFLMKKGGK